MNVWITGVGSEERWGVKVSTCGSLVWGVKKDGGVKVSACGSWVWRVKKDGELRYECVDHGCGE